MSYSTLEIQRDGAVATLWMNRPEVFNAFDEQLIAELTQACQALDHDDSVRVVVLAGRGRHFSAGADLNWMRRAASHGEAENLADARQFARMLRTLATLSKPTVARVHGAALGGGAGLTAACQMAIASDDAVFSTSEVRFGIIPAVISPYVLQAIGPRQAQRYFQSGERFDAARALAMGLVSEVAPAAQLDARMAALTESLCADGPCAQRAARELIAAVHSRPLGEATDEDTAQRIARQRATAEAREGIAAFLEKRPADWLG